MHVYEYKTKQKKNHTINAINDPPAIDLKQQFLRAQNIYYISGDEKHKRRASLLKKE